MKVSLMEQNIPPTKKNLKSEIKVFEYILNAIACFSWISVQIWGSWAKKGIQFGF